MRRKRPASLDIARFMRRHWQREPLLVRGAFPGFRDPLSMREVLRLAGDADASSRLVRKLGARWTLEHGPFAMSRFKQLPRRDWTVLVQDTNHFSRRADALLGCFDFIPHARVDDVMVSYAVPGGGVGPHVDSYDVFLLQGHGRRRWAIAQANDPECIPGLDLSVLRRFRAEEEWVLEAGDMLYLPPGVAHRGVAETECLTWSIGFRAPSDREIVAGLLDFLHERLAPAGQYGDPGAASAKHPALIPQSMTAHIARVARQVRWSAADLREFAGRFLSEPKPQVYFEAPARPLSRTAFERRAARTGVALDPRSRLLFSGTMLFLNGERIEVRPAARRSLRLLADARRLAAPIEAAAAFWDTVHDWYLRGYVACEGENDDELR